MPVPPAPRRTPDHDEDTVRTSLPSVAEITLDAIFETLDRVLPSARERELRARAEVYRLAIAKRASVPPTDTQRSAMRDLVSSLHDAVMASVERGWLVARQR